MADKATALPLEESGWDSATITEFNDLVTMRQKFKQDEDQAKSFRATVDAKIESMLLQIGPQAKLQLGTVVVERVISSSASKLSPQKLLEAGVSASTIKACTEPGTSYSYVLVKDRSKAT